MPHSSQSGFYPPQTSPTTSFQPSPGELRFLDQVDDACRVKRFILFHSKRYPSGMGASDVRAS